MHEQYFKYDDELKKNEFLKRHYECLPFIGEKYENRRLLLVGESHYVPKKDVCYVDREDFYECGFDELKAGEYKGWINTRNVFEHRAYDKEGFDVFFSNTATEIARIINRKDDLSREQKIEAMHQYAFMNYFKRPSYEAGSTIRGLTKKDYDYAYDISSHIISVLNPKLVIFLSKKAFYTFCTSDYDGIFQTKYTIKSVSHPSCAWWNRKRRDGRCAREDFYDYVKDLLE